jgi:8-oxo-dGTP pyrophosphatase MutT (NUDIX family)
MAGIARALAAQGLLSPWRDETYDIRAAEEATAAFVLERAAVRFFGFTARSIHVNGLTRDGEGARMWIARRSPTKAIDPGMLDNMVGGGLASGSSISRTLVKEAWEEAGIPAELAGQARPAGTVRICREVPEGLHVEIIYAHDLELPRDFVPRNQDGEVAEFRCCRIEEVIAELSGDAPYTVDAGMVALDCLARLGWIGPLGGRLANPDGRRE